MFSLMYLDENLQPGPHTLGLRIVHPDQSDAFFKLSAVSMLPK